VLSLPANSKKITAALLLALFVFVHTAKALHIHADSYAGNHKNETAFKSSVQGVCSICEFQLARDSELPLPATTSNTFTFISKDYFSSSSAISLVHAFSFSDRGPPVHKL
jgi:hypothetical protein